MNINFWRPSKNEQIEMRKSLNSLLKIVAWNLAFFGVIVFLVMYPIVFYVIVGLIVASTIFYIMWTAFGPIKKDDG